jgi:hypothetical protein
MDEAGVPRDRLVLVNLRGGSNPMASEQRREMLAAALRAREVETVLVDPFGRAFTGTSQNDAGEVQAWLTGLDAFARSDVGASDLVLATHAGWNGERSRGSTALEDWADAIVTLTRADDDSRYLRAMGRDVEVEEDRLHFDPLTRHLSLTGSGSRSANAQRQQVEGALELVLAHLANNRGCSQRDLENAVEGRSSVIRDAARLGVDRGLITIKADGRARLHYLSAEPMRPDASERVPDTAEKVRPRVPYGDADASHDESDSPEGHRTPDALTCSICGTSEMVVRFEPHGPRCREHNPVTYQEES